MTQIFTGSGLGLNNSSLGLGSYGPKGVAALGQGGESVYLNAATGNLVVQQNDGFLADAGIGMNLLQTYNSQGAINNAWRFNLNAGLKLQGAANTAGSFLIRTSGDGHQSIFHYNEQQQQYLPDEGGTEHIALKQGQWIYQKGAQQAREYYNQQGQLVKIADKDGHNFQFIYSENQLTQIIDQSGRQQITWKLSQGLVRDVTVMSDGKTMHHLSYEYNEQSQLTKVSRDLGNGAIYWISYDYVADTNWLKTIRQSDGTSLHIDYDAQGRVVRLKDGEGRTTSYAYEAGHTTVTNGLGERWLYFYNEHNQLTGVDGPEHYRIRYHYEGEQLRSIVQGEQVWRFFYNEQNDCIRIEEPNGQITVRQYDAQHQLILERNFQQFDSDHHPINPRTTRYIYDDIGHLRFLIKADGTVTEYRYDSEGLLTSSRVYLKKAYNVDALSINQTVTQEELIAWSAIQNQHDISLVEYAYDWRGQLVEERYYAHTDSEGQGIEEGTLLTHFLYDAAGRLIEKSTPTAQGWSTTYYFYDDLGRLIQVIDNQNHQQKIEYDDALQRVIHTDANGLQTIELYDKSGLLLATTKLDAQRTYGTVSYQYNAAGLLISQTNEHGLTTYRFYTAEGLLQGLINSAGQVIEYAYNDAGLLVQTHHYATQVMTNNWSSQLPLWAAIKPAYSSNDRIEQCIYDRYNQLAYRINAQGAVVHYEYDAAGNLITTTAFAKRLPSYQADKILSLAELHIEKDSIQDRTTVYYYDKAGQLQAQVDADGYAKEYVYDRQGHLIETIRYSLRIKTAMTSTWEQSRPQVYYGDIHHYFFYDGRGLKFAEIDEEWFATEFFYNERGLLIERHAYAKRIPVKINSNESFALYRPPAQKDDQKTFYRYDDLDQLAEEHAYNGLITTYSYNASGQVLNKIKMDSKTKQVREQQFRYDSMGRLIQSLDETGAALLASQSSLTMLEIEGIWQQHSVRYEYAETGLLLSKTNALGQKTRYFYDELSRLTHSVNAEGAVESFHYTMFNELESVYKYSQHLKLKNEHLTQDNLATLLSALADPLHDEVIHYQYNTLGLISSKQTGEKGVTLSEYNAFGELAQTHQRINNHTTLINNYTYTKRGQLAEVLEDVGGLNKQKVLAYDPFGHLKTQTDARGNTRKFGFTRRGEENYIYKESGGKTGLYKRLAYDAFGRVYDETDEGHSTSIKEYEYDDVNNTVKISYYGREGQVVTQFNAFGDKLSVTDAKGVTTSFEFDVKGQLIHSQGPEGREQFYEYDASGNLTFSTDAYGIQTQYLYDASGRMLTQIKDINGVKNTTTYQYDALGRQVRLISPNHIEKTFTYDNEGQLRETCVDPQGLNQCTQFSYDDRGLLLRTTEINHLGPNKVVAYEWDNLGRRVASIADPDGLSRVTRYDYDLNDNVICVTDANGHSTHYIFDEDNQCRFEVNARGVVSEYVYSASGLVKQKIVYANSIVSLNEYSEAQVRAFLIIDDKHDQSQWFRHDVHGKLIGTCDALGYYTAYIYDDNGNVIRKKMYAIPVSLDEVKKGRTPRCSEEGARIEYMLYDGANQLRFKWSKGVVTESCYDKLGQLTQVRRYANKISTAFIPEDISSIQGLLVPSDEDRTIRYAYDSLGNLSKEVSAQGVAKTYQYDSVGHLIAMRHYATLCPMSSDGDLSTINFITHPADRTSHYIYDALGEERYRISSEGRVIERCYDSLGNVIKEIHHTQLMPEGPYTLERFNKALIPSLAAATTYQYNATGQLINEQNSKQANTHYEYDAQGNLIKKTQANQTQWRYVYNESNQLIETYSPEVMLGQIKRSVITRSTYDSFGNMLSLIGDAEGIKRSEYYEYNVLNQKIKTIYPNVSVNQTQAHAASSRTEISKELSEELRYNAFGQVIAKCDKAQHWSYSLYDDLGQLTYAINSQGAVTEYLYSSFGELSSKTLYASALTDVNQDTTGAQMEKKLHSSIYDRSTDFAYNKDGLVLLQQQNAVRSYDAKTKQYSLATRPTTKTAYNAFGEVVKVSTQINKNEWADTFYYYDGDGKNTAQVNAEQYLTTYIYNALGFLERTIEGAVRVKQADSLRYVASLAHQQDRTVEYTYDSLGQLTQKTLKNATLAQKNSAGKYATVIKDLTTFYTYDALGHVTSTTDAQGNTAYSYYNELGQMIAKVAPKTQEGRAATTYTYDGLGNLLETRRWAKEASSADEEHFQLTGESTQDQITRQIYDAQGYVLEQTDALNHAIYYSYDEQGNLARSWQLVTQFDKSVQVQDKHYSYDSEGHLLQTKTFKSSDTFKTEDAQYNIFGELISKGINGVYTSEVEYDTQGRVWRTNSQGYYQIYVYDLQGRVTQVVTKSNGVLKGDGVLVNLASSYFETAQSFDNDNWLFDLQRQNNSYDALGHLIKEEKNYTSFDRDATALSLQQVHQQQTVDRWGNIVSFINYQGLETKYEYNNFDQLVKKELPEVSIMNEQGIKSKTKPAYYYYYDELGRAIGMMDANGHSVSKEYDALGHLIKEEDAKGVGRAKHYNLLEQLTSLTNELGGITTYLYDAANRLTHVKTPKTSQSYEYDELGQLVRQVNGAKEETRFAYDMQGNLIQQRNAKQQSTFATFDDAGHKISEINALNHQQTWRYNDAGLLEEHTDLGGHTTNYIYNDNNLLLEEHSSAGKNTRYTYQGDGALVEYADFTHDETVFYGYDSAGQLIKKSSSRGGDLSGWLREMDYYEYDELGRMTRILRKNPADENKNAPRPDKTLLNVEYDYDAVGNIRHTKTHANYTGYTTVQSDDYFLYDENDRMSVNKGQLVDNQIKITASQGSSLQYDAAGNIQTALKYEQGALHQYTYQYNNDNQLELIKKNNYSIQSKIYDDAGRVITENLYNNKGQVTQKNIMTYDKGELVAQHVKNHADVEQSHTIYKYDEAGNITDSTVTAYEYEAETKNASTYSHHYSYALWDNYLQENDYATQTHAGQSTSGKSTRYYDANGLLKQSIDNQRDENNYSHSSKYWNSAIDGMKARQDDSGITHYLNANHKTIGDLHLKNNKSQELNVFGGFTPQGSTHSKNIGSGSLGEFLARQAQSRGEGIEPESTQDNLGAYTVQSSDSLESIALQVYGDGSLWYLIADANGLNCSKSEIAQGSSSLHSGQRLTIPPVATGQHHTDGTKKIRSAEYYIGNTSATTLTPLPPAPPPFPKERNNIFAKIVVGVVATVATVLTAGVAGVLAGVAGSSIFTIGSAVLAGSAIGSIGGTMAAGFAAGVIGNLVSQGIGTALKLQDSINIKGALVNGLISAATAGVLKGVDQIATHKAAMTKLGENKLNTYFNLQSAAETMEYNATSQGMALAIHQQQHFQWNQFAISSATAGILGGKAGKALQEKLKQIDFNTGLLSSEFNALAHNALSAVTGATFNAKDALVGNLGGALGQGLVNANTSEQLSLVPESEAIEQSLNEMLYDDIILDILNPERSTDALEQNYKAYQISKKSVVSSPKKQLSIANAPKELLTYKQLQYESEGSKNKKYKTDWGFKNHEAKDFIADSLTMLDSLNLTPSVKEYQGIYSINYSLLFSSKGDSYKKIASNSYYNKTPGSPIWGDASKALQMESIDALITAAKKHDLNLRDTAHLLAIARHESGFNPYAAAGTTSAVGLGQFIKETGNAYGLKDHNRWDINSQANSLVKIFIDIKNKVRKLNISDQYIYKFHHDGMNSSLKKIEGLELSKKKVYPQISKISETIKILY